MDIYSVCQNLTLLVKKEYLEAPTDQMHGYNIFKNKWVLGFVCNDVENKIVFLFLIW